MQQKKKKPKNKYPNKALLIDFGKALFFKEMILWQ